MKLKAWSNGQGYSFRDWDFAQNTDGTWAAVQKPSWFGGVAKFGKGATYAAAMMVAKKTEEFKDFWQRNAERAAA